MNTVKRDDVVKALEAIGYKTVEFFEVKIRRPVGEQKTIKVIPALDVFATPSAVMTEIDGRKNFAALKVAADMGLKYRELQQFSGSVILREVENLG